MPTTPQQIHQAVLAAIRKNNMSPTQKLQPAPNPIKSNPTLKN